MKICVRALGQKRVSAQLRLHRRITVEPTEAERTGSCREVGRRLANAHTNRKSTHAVEGGEG